MTDDQSADEAASAVQLDDEPAVKLFGDPRSPFVERGPDRRSTPVPAAAERTPAVRPMIISQEHPRLGPGRALRLGSGDGMATGIAILGYLVFATTLIAGGIILYNAKTVGAFNNPWDSTRVAIGLAVLAIGIVQSALLLGVSRVISYLLAGLRMRSREMLESQRLHDVEGDHHRTIHD